MLYRLVRLIETHSQSLATCLLDRVQTSELTHCYKENVPPDELKEKVYEIYHHLGEWLIAKDETDLQSRYLQIGARRAAQRVPLSEVIWVIVLTRKTFGSLLRKRQSWSVQSKSLGNWRCCNSWNSSLIARFISRQWGTNSRWPTRFTGKAHPPKARKEKAQDVVGK